MQDLVNRNMGKGSNQNLLSYLMQPKRSITHSEIMDVSGSKVKRTRLEQHLDDTKVVVESFKPFSGPYPTQAYASQPRQPKPKYHIEIEDEMDDNLDVVVNMAGTRSPMIKQNPQTKNIQSPKPHQQLTNSRITIKSTGMHDYDYSVTIKSEDTPSRSSYYGNYQTVVAEANIKIKSPMNNREEQYRSVPYGNTYTHANMHTHANEYTNTTNSGMEKRKVERVEKEFALGKSKVQAKPNTEVKTKVEGKIIRNGDSQKHTNPSANIYELDVPNVAMTESILQKSEKLMQKQKQQREQTSKNKVQVPKKQPLKSWAKPTPKLSTSTKSDIESISPIKNKSQIQINNQRNFNTNSTSGIQPKTKENRFEKPVDLHTPSNKQGRPERELTRSKSPVVQDYREEDEEAARGYLIDQSYSQITGPKIFDSHSLKTSWNEQQYRMVTEPEPYTSRSRQIRIQDSEEWTPSLKDIHYQDLPSKEIPSTLPETRRKDVIVVPVSSSGIAQPIDKDKEPVRKVTVTLNSTAYQERERRRISKQREQDEFTLSKNKILNTLRTTEKSKTGASTSRNKRQSLSPECERITNRLYTSRVNKGICPKLLNYQSEMQMKRLKETLGEYSFIRRYLTDPEINDLILQMERMGVPQRKWSVKLVDVVYDKLKQIKIY